MERECAKFPQWKESGEEEPKGVSAFEAQAQKVSWRCVRAHVACWLTEMQPHLGGLGAP